MIAEWALNGLASITAGAAGLAIGLSVYIAWMYWRRYRQATNPTDRMLPAHVVLIALSYAALALVAVARLDQVPEQTALRTWWIYPTIGGAFLIGDVALVLILRFVAIVRREPGPRR